MHLNRILFTKATEKISNYHYYSAGPSFKTRLIRKILLFISGHTKLCFCCFADGFPEHVRSTSHVPQYLKSAVSPSHHHSYRGGKGFSTRQ